MQNHPRAATQDLTGWAGHTPRVPILLDNTKDL